MEGPTRLRFGGDWIPFIRGSHSAPWPAVCEVEALSHGVECTFRRGSLRPAANTQRQPRAATGRRGDARTRGAEGASPAQRGARASPKRRRAIQDAEGEEAAQRPGEDRTTRAGRLLLEHGPARPESPRNRWGGRGAGLHPGVPASRDTKAVGFRCSAYFQQEEHGKVGQVEKRQGRFVAETKG